MNEKLQQFARNYLKDGLLQCTNEQQFIFARMYSHKNIMKKIDIIVDDMEEKKLDWAMQQIERTLLKNKTEKVK